MRRWRRWISDESGSASLEFVTAGVLLLVPLVYLVIALSVIQSGSFGVEGAARAGARVFVQSAPVDAATTAAAVSADFALRDYGIDPKRATVTITCDPDPTDCLTRGGHVTVTVSTTVTLPLAPPLPGLAVPAGIPVVAASTEEVSRFVETQ
jgi:Flp pilus assembly protein TadG